MAFSLSALMAQEAAAARRRQERDQSPDRESGMIDLKALTAGADPVPAHLAVFPFGAPTPPAQAAPEPASSTPAPRRTGKARVVGMAMAMLIAATGGVLFGLRASEAAPRPVAVAGLAQAARNATPRVTAAPVTPPATETTPPAASPKPADTVKATPPVAPLGRAPVVRPTPAPNHGETTTPTQGKTPPVADPCHGDLLCAMQRAAGK